jgi:glutamate mutase epsilon subunit
MGANTTADGSRIRCMEWESTDGLVGPFTKAVLQINRGMAWVFIGILVATSIKAIIRKVKGMFSK